MPETKTDSPSSRDALIESIYRIALEPQTYDTFMGQWDSYISEQLEELETLRASDHGRAQSGQSPEVEAHFEIAAKLLDQMGRPGTTTPNAGTTQTRNPQMLIDASGQIAWTSSAAENLFGIHTKDHVANLDIAPDTLDALQSMINGLLALQTVAPPAPLVMHLGTVTDDATPVYMVARILPDKTDEALLLLTKATPDWPPEMARLLARGFGLTDAEIAICEGVAEGLGPAEIAAARGNTPATVRTQLKKVMAKTHCVTQAKLVRLLHSMMHVADQDPGTAARSWSSAERITTFSLPDRQMMIEHYGDPSGYPVIFFHGMLDGNSITHALQAELRRNNLHLICPVRPWFGSAPGSPGPARTAMERFAKDIERYLDSLNVEKPILLGHMAGALYAFATAALMPSDKLRGILNVSGGVPISSVRQFSYMSNRQRLVAYTARYTPAILPFVVRAGISQMDNGGERAFLNSLWENAPDDLALIADPEIRDLILSGLRFTMQQGHKAFEVDSHNVVRDWTAVADASDIPVKLLNGASDPVISPASLREFAGRRANRISLDLIDGVGQLVLYKHPKKVIAALCALRDGK